MKNFITLICCILFAQIASASTFSQLCTVNKHWQTQADENAINQLNNAPTHLSQQDWIALHLQLVSKTLLQKSTTNLATSQSQNRKNLLHILQQYADAKSFPINNYKSYQTPIFIDANNTHCAVGYLMQQSNAEQLAQQINATEQFAYLNDIQTKGVQQWADKNGFTIEELAWIQPGYPAYTPFYNVDTGVDGTVNCMVKLDDNTVLFGGNFITNNKNVTCNNLALATNVGGVWTISNIGAGANAPIHCMYKQGNIIYIGGDFTTINGVPANHIAKYDLLSSALPFSALAGGVNGTVKTIAGFNNAIYIGGSFTNMLSKYNGTSWQDMNMGSFIGNSVNALFNHNNALYFGGDFEFLSGSLRTNIGLITTSDDLVYVGYGYKNTINDFAFWDNNLYAACSIKMASNDSSIIYKWDVAAQDWYSAQTHQKTVGTKINKFLVSGMDLFAVGNFDANTMMYSGSHFAKIRKDSNAIYLDPVLSLDAPANCALAMSDKIMLGGDFTLTASWIIGPSLRNIANKIGYINYTPTAISKIIKQTTTLTIYPNPTTGIIYLPNQTWESVIIYNTNGVCLFDNTSVINSQINVDQLPAGNYFVVAINKAKQSFSAKFTKQ